MEAPVKIPKRLHLVIVLILMLSVGKYFSFFIVQIFENEIKLTIRVNSDEISQLLEWAQWPSMILAVIIGFSLDANLRMMSAIIIFSTTALIAQGIMVVSVYQSSFYLSSLSQILSGVAYDALFVIQMTLLARLCIDTGIYTPMGTLICVCQTAVLIGNYVLPEIFKASNSLLKTISMASIPHLVSFGAAMGLVYFHDIIDKNPRQDFVITRNHSCKFFIILIIFFFHLSPDLQFWRGFGHLLFWKYDIYDSDDVIIAIFYLVNGVAAFVMGILLDRLNRKLKPVLLFCSLLLMLVSHLLLTFTFITPYLSIPIIGIVHAVVGLTLRASILYTVPRNEFATAMGFIQAIECLTFAASNNYKYKVILTHGFIILGSVHVLCIMVALFAAVILWYLQ